MTSHQTQPLKVPRLQRKRSERSHSSRERRTGGLPPQLSGLSLSPSSNCSIRHAASRPVCKPRGVANLIQRRRSYRAVPIRETYQPCKARLAVLPNILPKLAGFGPRHDRLSDRLHFAAAPTRLRSS